VAANQWGRYEIEIAHNEKERTILMADNYIYTAAKFYSTAQTLDILGGMERRQLNKLVNSGKLHRPVKLPDGTAHYLKQAVNALAKARGAVSVPAITNDPRGFFECVITKVERRRDSEDKRKSPQLWVWLQPIADKNGKPVTATYNPARLFINLDDTKLKNKERNINDSVKAKLKAIAILQKPDFSGDPSELVGIKLYGECKLKKVANRNKTSYSVFSIKERNLKMSIRNDVLTYFRARPTEKLVRAELVEKFDGVSLSSIVKALAQLEKDGLIAKVRHGQYQLVAKAPEPRPAVIASLPATATDLTDDEVAELLNGSDA
jgi:Fe2+ or Zn2+ uptake regulation protein